MQAVERMMSRRLQLVQDGLGQLVADVALGHGAGLGEGHVRGLVVVGRRVGERVVDHADLGAVAVGDDDVGAVLDHVHDVLGGVPHERKLLLRGVAEGVAAQGDDDGLAVALFVWHKRSPYNETDTVAAADGGDSHNGSRFPSCEERKRIILARKSR